MKTKTNNSFGTFYDIHSIINANAIEMADGSKWVSWSLRILNKGITARALNKIAHNLTK